MVSRKPCQLLSKRKIRFGSGDLISLTSRYGSAAPPDPKSQEKLQAGCMDGQFNRNLEVFRCPGTPLRRHGIQSMARNGTLYKFVHFQSLCLPTCVRWSSDLHSATHSVPEDNSDALPAWKSRKASTFGENPASEVSSQPQHMVGSRRASFQGFPEHFKFASLHQLRAERSLDKPPALYLGQEQHPWESWGTIVAICAGGCGV